MTKLVLCFCVHGTSVKLWTSSFGFQTTKFFLMVVRKISESFIFFSCSPNRRRVGLTVFFMGAILYALFLAVFSHYLYCGHYFKGDNITFVNNITHNTEVFEVSETNKIKATISRFFQFLRSNPWIWRKGRNRTKQFLPLIWKLSIFLDMVSQSLTKLTVFSQSA